MFGLLLFPVCVFDDGDFCVLTFLRRVSWRQCVSVRDSVCQYVPAVRDRVLPVRVTPCRYVPVRDLSTCSACVDSMFLFGAF